MKMEVIMRENDHTATASMGEVTLIPFAVKEVDPTVPDWAKQPTKPQYTAKEVGAVATVNGVSPDKNGNVEIDIGGGSVEGAVLYTPQTLADEQKAQARDNIGAAPMSLFNIIEGDDTPKLTSIMPAEDEFAVGKFINYDTGNITDVTTYRCTEYYIAFPVGAKLMTHYSVNSIKNAYPHVAYYDANKTFISYEFGIDLTQEDYEGKLCAFYNVPQNARFIRLSVPDNVFSLGYFGHLYLYTITEVKVNGGVEIPNLIVPMDAIANSDILVRGALPLMGKTIVNFGDSIFGNAQPPTDISTFLAEKTGATVYNCGFGGCRMSPHPTAEYHAFSMYKLANAISTGDFTEQENAVNSTTVTLNNAIKSNFATLKTIDFSKVDIVTIAYGANDFNGALLDNAENPLDTTTFGGALRYSIEKLLTSYPHLRIFVLSTTWRFWINESNEYVDDTNTHTNGLGKLIADYNAQLKAVAEEYNLPFVDDYNIGIGKFNRSYYFNDNDGAHHKTTGRNAIAEHLAKNLW